MQLRDVYTAKDGVSLFWLGNDGWVINLYGTVFATDLDLYLDERLPLPQNFDFTELAQNLGALFLTHAHGDHFNEKTCLRLAGESKCLFVVPESCTAKARELGLPEERIVISEPGKELSVLDLRVSCVRALHGHLKGSVYAGASMGDCGYRIEKNGFTLYEPGDTVLLHEHFEMKGIDLAFVSPTEHNMEVRNSLIYLTQLDPRFIIPQHYGSYAESPDNLFWTHGYVEELEAALPAKFKNRFLRPEGQGVPMRII